MFSFAGSYFKTGIKNCCIENACAIDAAKSAAPYPAIGIKLVPVGADPTIQAKKIQYKIILITPYPNKWAPNRIYFRKSIRANKATALSIGFNILYDNNPPHC